MYDLVKNNTVIKSKDFTDTPPILSANKGVWLERVLIIPEFNNKIHNRTLEKRIEPTQTIWEYIVTDKTLDDVISNKLLDLDKIGFTVENQGITVGGMSIDTSREAVSRVASGLSYMGRNPNATIDFETKTGWSVANKSSLELIQDAMFTHLHTASTNKKVHYEAINLLTDNQSIIDYDITVGW